MLTVNYILSLFITDNTPSNGSGVQNALTLNDSASRSTKRIQSMHTDQIRGRSHDCKMGCVGRKFMPTSFGSTLAISPVLRPDNERFLQISQQKSLIGSAKIQLKERLEPSKNGSIRCEKSRTHTF